MKKLILILAILWGSVASATGFYSLVFERGDTLENATEDTTESCFIYPSDNVTRPIRPTVHIDFTEIGSNSTHYWWEIFVDVARTNLTKPASGWSEIGVVIVNDWIGLAGTSQNDKVIALPFLEQYAFQYFRLRIHAPVGVAADSTGYHFTYNADQSGNMYTPPQTFHKTYTQKDIWNTTGSKLIVGGATSTTGVIDLRIETSPGVFRLADRGVLTVYGSTGDNKCDDDTIDVYVRRKAYNATATTNIDTLTMPIGATTAFDGVFSFALPGGGTGFIDAITLNFIPENASVEDSCYIFTNVYLEVDQ